MDIASFLLHVPIARLDALILLEDCLGKGRAQILAHDEQELTDEQLAWLDPRVQRRANNEPLAYIRGHVEFYGRDFIVSPDVLVPRPESEAMIELLKTLTVSNACDVGTGSGCLGITAKLELPKLAVTLIDVSQSALDIARQNAAKHQVSVQLLHSDLLASNNEPYDVLLANLPYVPDSYPINAAAKQEPSLALFAGKDGFDLYRQLFVQANTPYVVTEALAQQHSGLAAIARENDYQLAQTMGLAQLFTRVSQA